MCRMRGAMAVPCSASAQLQQQLHAAALSSECGFPAAIGHDDQASKAATDRMSLLVGRCQFSSRARCPRFPRGSSVYRLPQTETRHHKPTLKLHAQRPDQAVPDEELSLLSALTKLGLLGTIAVTGASLCGLKIFSYFQWNVSDILLALYLNSALLLLELLLFAPWWSIPPSLVASGRQQSSAALNGDAQDLVDMSAVTAASLDSLQSWQLMLALYKVVLPNPLLERSPLLARIGYCVALQTTRELFIRGFILTALAGWITDRCYEAGLNDVITVTPQLSFTLQQLGLWVAAIAVTAVVAPVAAAAEAREAVGEVSGALLLRTEIGQQLAAAKAGSSSSSSRSSSTSISGGSTSVDVMQQQDLLTGLLVQEQQQPEAADREDDQDNDDDDDDAILDPDVLEFRLIKLTEECVSSAPIKMAYNITYATEFGRVMLANVCFVETGNLAATLSCALLLEGMLQVYAIAAAAIDGNQQRQP